MYKVYFDKENFNVDVLSDMETDVAFACSLDIKDACIENARKNYVRGVVATIITTSTIIVVTKIVKYFANKNVKK